MRHDTMQSTAGVTPVTENPRKDRIVVLYLELAALSAKIRNQKKNNASGSIQVNKKIFNEGMYELCTLSQGYVSKKSVKKYVKIWRNTPRPAIMKTLELFEQLVEELSNNDVIKR